MADPAFLLDANICVYLLGGGADVLRSRVEDCEPGALVTSSIAFAEVLIGAVRRDGVAEALALFRAIPPLPFGSAEAEAYARLPFRRGSFDRLIAAHAITLGLTLVTANEKHFAGVPNLNVENWALPQEPTA
ncbi:type II toxin-antitoxin system VapC family toxin [Sphingomonas bacterium]|uniref:type II toxin-antitoxin system VapC family toxin n=1 Tax=Sphingomonas bacterium TaxID=1895847 RepID=UPI0015765005|nr:type II toxin-antitoxin system VapC family toxin [Sphingomonas bacterium]